MTRSIYSLWPWKPEECTANNAPDGVTGLTATASGSTTINLSWDADTTAAPNQATSYAIARSSNGVGYVQIATVTAPATSYSDTSLSAGQTRYYEVTPTNCFASGSADLASATTAAGSCGALAVPDAPFDLASSGVTSSAITLEWDDTTASPDEAEDYEIGISSDGGSTWTTITKAAPALSHTFTSLSASTTYDFRIRGVNCFGTGNYDGESFSETTAAASYNVEYLVIAGGGGGGGAIGGGGGAGGYRTATGFSLTVGQSYTVTVGAGGAGGAASTGAAGNGSNGSNSVFSTITSTGGGYGTGGANVSNPQTGGSGGSGGGAGSSSTVNNAPGTGTSGQGNDGGDDNQAGAGGGGGGAGAVGAAGVTNGAGAGGSGSTFNGTDYAGGGGGGRFDSNLAGAGGSGGGGAGGNNAVGSAGTVNLGGGGGGGAFVPVNTSYAGGSGGSGVVILRMATANYSGTTTGSPTVTTSGSDTILTFNASGSYTA